MKLLKSRLGLGIGYVLPRLIKDYSECRLVDRGLFNWPRALIWDRVSLSQLDQYQKGYHIMGVDRWRE
jgi:hypothetical protein